MQGKSNRPAGCCSTCSQLLSGVCVLGLICRPTAFGLHVVSLCITCPALLSTLRATRCCPPFGPRPVQDSWPLVAGWFSCWAFAAARAAKGLAFWVRRSREHAAQRPHTHTHTTVRARQRWAHTAFITTLPSPLPPLPLQRETLTFCSYPLPYSPRTAGSGYPWYTYNSPTYTHTTPTHK